ncbi:MAG: reverse transcriptase domain-containing protein [Pseudomonadota bacterium]|nr:reverse transcriptase domain-containing protein [Pseudomonadota bacterium]
MKKWHPQRYKQNALQLKRNTEITKNALRIGHKVNCNKALPIFTLAHLSKQSGIDSTILDKLVQRREIDPNTPIYRVFSIKKRTTSEKRYICVPCHELKTVQRFIHEKILLQLESHQAVTSYKSDCTIYEAAKHHCSSKWMIKLDLKDFFDSISEVSVYRVFRKVGYSALLSFQMARLCTRVIPKLESNTTSLARIQIISAPLLVKW